LEGVVSVRYAAKPTAITTRMKPMRFVFIYVPFLRLC
jgi:hypothetical protein